MKQFGHVIEGLIVIRLLWTISMLGLGPRIGIMISPIKKKTRKWKISLALRIDQPEEDDLEVMRRSAER